MTQTLRPPPGPAPDYCTHWIRRLRLADDLPAPLAGRSVRAAIREAPPGCCPPPLEAWLFDAAAGDGIDLAVTYMADLVRNHPFIDGNKRVGFVVGMLFLEIDVHLSPPTRRKRPERCWRWRAG